MKKNFYYIWKVLQFAWRANGLYVSVKIFTDVYTATLYPLIQMILLARVIDLLVENMLLENLLWIGAAYTSASLLNYYLANYDGLKQPYFQNKMEFYLDSVITQKLSQLDPATFEKAKFQNSLAQLNGTIGVMVMLQERLSGLINAIVKVIAAGIILFPLFPIFIPLIVIATLPAYFVADRYRVKLFPYFITKRAKVRRVITYIYNLLSSDSTSKEAAIFKTGSVMQQKISQVKKGYFIPFNKISERGVYLQFLSTFLQLAAFLYAQYLLLLSVLRHVVSIGQFTLYFQQIMNLAYGVENILGMYSSISMRVDTVEAFFQFLEIESMIKPNPHPIPFPEKKDQGIEIAFRNVSFHYPKQDRDILHDFNLTMHPGEKIAIVGENGAGKTTLIKLLLRFYDVTEGELLINGINIKELDLNEWHKKVGALFQDFIKYQFTFKDNIAFGDLDKKPDESLLRTAMKQSGADTYFGTLPKGFDQIVGKMFDEGIDLSGGQWQKLALARAFFRNAPILILDEPTSAIDAKAEYEIFENVQKLQKDKTVIIISHRFSTVRNADRILVLDEGKIVEEGNHEKLMKKKGLYAELFELQAKGYK